MDIEEVAHKTPEKILTRRPSIRPPACRRYQARELAFGLGLKGAAGRASSRRIAAALYRLYLEQGR